MGYALLQGAAVTAALTACRVSPLRETRQGFVIALVPYYINDTKEKMACSSPVQINGYTVACNRCDKCVGRRVHSWCARAMMEREVMGNALVVALTYSEDTEHSRRSALMFDYKDVQDFLKNLRRQVDYHLGRRSAVSFIAAGEMGERFGRCHWHVVLFSEVDLLQVGRWSAPWGPVEDASEIITPPGGQPRRRGWSMWKHGFCTVQEPDYGGMRYALAYALKDQFNVLNSFGTMREAGSEVFGTGYLVMSKKPPIGARWIDAYVERCRASGVVPPTKQLSVDGLTRPFWPSGLLADRLLAGLASVNAEIVEKTGANAAGWSSLLHEVRDNDNDLEIMGVLGVEEIEGKPREKDALFGLRLEDKGRWSTWSAARRNRAAQISDWRRASAEAQARFRKRFGAYASETESTCRQDG